MSETSEGQEWQLQGKDKNGRDNGNTRMPDTREVPECQQQVKDKKTRDKESTRFFHSIN